MSTSTISWYSTDTNLSVVDRGAVTKEDAMKVIESYFAKLKPRYESAEEAISETMFGFQKSKEEFVEVCINGRAEISFKYEVSAARKILFLSVPKLIEKELTLRSIDEVRSVVSSFYELNSTAFQNHLGI